MVGKIATKDPKNDPKRVLKISHQHLSKSFSPPKMTSWCTPSPHFRPEGIWKGERGGWYIWAYGSDNGPLVWPKLDQIIRPLPGNTGQRERERERQREKKRDIERQRDREIGRDQEREREREKKQKTKNKKRREIQERDTREERKIERERERKKREIRISRSRRARR